MNEIVLELAALLLSLFCLIYSVSVRRELYAPLPKRLIHALQNQHFAFLGVLASIALTAASSVAAELARNLGGGVRTMTALRSAYYLLHLLPAYFFSVFLIDLCGPAKKRGPRFWWAYSLPLLLGAVLAAVNPLTRFCFTMTGGGAVQRSGPGMWVLFSVAVFYLAAGFLYFFRFCREMTKAERRAALVLMTVVLLGVVIQAVWSAPVELFFEAIAFFGFMALLEHDRDASENGMSRRFRGSAVVALAFTFLAVIVVNITLIQGINRSQADKLGNIRLDVIRGDLEDTVTSAENNLLRVAVDAENLLNANASHEQISEYITRQKERFLADESFMNLYIADPDWLFVPDFTPPEDFHATERLWYLGAKESPGSPFLTEPYLDVTSGGMCITESVLLADGKTVVGYDLNLSKAQESILRMTEDTDQTAMIVTDQGLIIGYTDMALVGEKADDKLPEYAEVLRRVAASKDHVSFQVTLNGRSCRIFSSETKNHWYLILSVDTDTLYAESNRQMTLMAAVNLLMLVVVITFYLISTRNSLRAEESLKENERFIDGVADRLHHAVTQIQLLNESQFQETGEGALAQIRDTGTELNDLSQSIRSYSTLLRAHVAKQENRKEKELHGGAVEAPSRRARNGVILTLLFTMLIVLILCCRSAIDAGNTRMEQAADAYENELNQWITREQSILYAITDVITSQPSLMENYEDAVHLLHDYAANYPEISACYLANPYAEHPVIMDSGWEPGADFRPETRPWYKAAQLSPTHFSISAPYMDAQTNTYCVTFSRVVYGEQGEFLGIFGVDFFLDQLIQVLGDSYAETSYAFLVDSEGVIINHPYEAYQMNGSHSVSVEDTLYADAYNSQSASILRDDSGQFFACVSRKTASGFTVMLANSWWSIYGGLVLVSAAALILFGLCIVFIVLLINRLIRWQEKTNRQLVEAAETAKKADKAKSQFLAQMSHEIRTPMNAIIGLDNIALREPDLAPHVRDELEKIGASARHLLSLINDILDMSRIESGRMALKETDFSFREFMEQICVIINGQCQDKGLKFESAVIGQMDASFVGDDLKLKQVVINILGNSVKFTDAPGTVSFTAQQVESRDDARVLRFTMKDTGVGMDKAFIPKLFEAFSQEDATNTNRYGGSGLGMAITKSIVEMMGGSIQVESEKGLGSIFTVTVALKPGAAKEAPVGGQAADATETPEAPETPETPEKSLAGKRMLIAEDNEINAEILTDLLDLEDVSCEWAENGQIAVEKFAASAEGYFDAILMDMRMPVMDGLTATAEIRKLNRPDAKNIPIIALTANAFEEDVQHCLQAGMNAHLSKPVDMALLKKTVGRLLA
ncbi:MAG: response regulator [Clostridia bacterium]|nr:response regulator [Clostridia bacterium]